MNSLSLSLCVLCINGASLSLTLSPSGVWRHERDEGSFTFPFVAGKEGHWGRGKSYKHT